ncbi:MAG: selenocysteine-specific translation elongation factor [Burkholderiales bacterium]|nr:selenocysteine-specific translation elongation factor [Burkholderiales bacterium]
MIVATAGHIDHGKTLLVKALTGVDTDRLPDEKRRGLTIDLGFAYLPDAAAGTIGFIDVPGHERFVHNMLCGVAGIDAALFVVAADDGPMPQTLEHLAILDLLGVRHGLVALTKIDRVPAARAAEVRDAIVRLLAPTTLAAARVFPVSAVTGEGIGALGAELHRLAAALPRRAAAGNFRLAVDRAFSVAGAGLVVTGTVFSGAIATGDAVRALVAGVDARVRNIHAQSAQAERGRAGARCALNLAGAALKDVQIARGDWLVRGALPPPVRKIDARIRVMVGEAQPLRHWTPVHVHLGAAATTARVATLEADAIEPGACALAQLVLDRPIGAVHGDRLILRDQSARRTLGGGHVIDVYAPPRGRARPERLAALRAMEAADPAEALKARLAVLADARANGLDLRQFAACRNLTGDEVAALYAHAPMHRVAAGASEFGFLAEHWRALRARALETVAAWHRRLPDSPGPPEARILEGGRLPPEVVGSVAAELVRDGALARSGATLRLPAHRSTFTPADEALWQRISAVLGAQAQRPATVAEIAGQLGAAPKAVLAVLDRAARRGLAVRISDTRFFPPRTVARLAELAQRLAESNAERRVTAAQFRDASGLGRNLSIEMLDYFDRVRFTRRIGDARIVLKAAAEAFAEGEPGAR